MRALTLTQPWAGLVASGVKLVENRPRRMIKSEDFGKPFAIHASRVHDESVWPRIIGIEPRLALDHPESLTRRDRMHERMTTTSCVIGVAAIHGCITGSPDIPWHVGEIVQKDQMRWFFGPIGYVLRDVIALHEPVPCRGWQGFWTLPDDVERAVRAQLAEAA
jgi:hypothetical protein